VGGSNRSTPQPSSAAASVKHEIKEEKEEDLRYLQHPGPEAGA
jgi:hypothetical protein